jgi:hypothetical protein
MRRKVLQDFANVFCQKFVDLPSGYDLATFVHFRSGFYLLDIVSGDCTRDGTPIPPLMTCKEYREWLQDQLTRRKIPLESLRVTMGINVLVSAVKVKTSFGHIFASAFFECNCRSAIRTDEKTYLGHHRGAKAWGFDWYYQRLYGNPMRLVEAQPESS